MTCGFEHRRSNSFGPIASLDHIFTISFHFLIVLHRLKGLELDPNDITSIISPNSFLIQLLIDDMLLIGNVVESWAREFEMVKILAKLTGHHLELVRDIPALVSQKAK